MFGWFARRPTPEGFAKEILARIRKADPTLAASYDAERFEIRFGDAGVLNLGNLYAQYEQLPRRERGGLIKVAADLALNPQTEIPDWDQARTQVLPRVQSRLFVDTVRSAHAALPGLQVPTRTLCEHLVVSLVFDLSDRMMYVNSDQLERWGISFEEGLEAARNQLWRNSNQSFKEERPGFWASAWQDNYDASRVLLQSLIWQLKVDGEPVALVTDRDHLFVTGSRDQANLLHLLEKATAGLQAQYSVSPLPLVLREERWEPFVPPGEAWERHARVVRAGLYAEQRELLGAHFGQSGQDVFVAECSMLSHKQKGVIFSFCVVSPDVEHSLLPETEVVMLAASEPLRLPWTDFVRLLGPRLEPTEHWPPRWRVRPGLTVGEWEGLVAAGSSL